MTEPLVSVVIPMYNSQEFISECIDSVLAQTYQNIELIIVDDCSTDDSVSVVQTYCEKGDRVKLIKLSSNSGGPAKPRNVGIKASHGKYIAFIDADDLWFEGKTADQVQLMEENDYNITSTRALFVTKNEKILLVPQFLSLIRPEIPTIHGIIRHNFIIMSSIVATPSAIGLFDEDLALSSVEDHKKWLELFSNKDTRYYMVKKATVKYRVMTDTLVDRTNPSAHEAKKLICVARHIEESGNYDLVKDIYYRYFVVYIISKIKSFIGLIKGLVRSKKQSLH